MCSKLRRQYNGYLFDGNGGGRRCGTHPFEDQVGALFRGSGQHIVIGEPEGLAAAIAGAIPPQPPADDGEWNQRVDYSGEIMDGNLRLPGDGTRIVLVQQNHPMAHRLAVKFRPARHEFIDAGESLRSMTVAELGVARIDAQLSVVI